MIFFEQEHDNEIYSCRFYFSFLINKHENVVTIFLTLFAIRMKYEQLKSLIVVIIVYLYFS